MGCGKVHLYGLGVLLIRVITFCKLLRVFRGFSQVGDSHYRVIFLTIQSMGQTPFPNPSRSKTHKITFFNCGLGVESWV
jgi:hypothetical protein